MLRLFFLFVGLVVVVAASPSWGIMVSASDISASGITQPYLSAGSGGISLLPGPGALPSDSGMNFIIPIGPTPTPPPDNQTPIPPTPLPGPVVPEPGTFALVGLGILAMAAARRKMRG